MCFGHIPRKGSEKLKITQNKEPLFCSEKGFIKFKPYYLTSAIRASKAFVNAEPDVVEEALISSFSVNIE